MSEIVFIKYHLKKFGGLEKYSLRILDAFLKKGYRVTLLTTNISNELLNRENLKVVFFPPPKTFKFLKILFFDMKCRSWIKKNNPRKVFSFDRSSIYTHTRLGGGIHLSFLNKRKLFENRFKLFLNSINPLHRMIINIEKKGFRQKKLKKIITNSNMVKIELSNYYNISADKILMIHNGVEYNEFEKEFSDWEIQKPLILKKLCLNLTDYHFIFVGNDYNRKGLEPLLKALGQIKNKNFHLSVLGKEKNMNKFKGLVHKLQLDKKVTFFGMRDDIMHFYQIADALVIPSYYDPFSNVAIEALAMGVFTITSQFNGAKRNN